MRYNKKFNKYCNLSNRTTIVELTQNQWTILDTTDWERLKEFKWHAHWNSCTKTFYVYSTVNRKNLQMHRIILGLLADDRRVADHANHDTLDNRKFVNDKEQLRIATVSQNNQNHKKHKNNTSGIIGVSKHVDRRRDKYLPYWQSKASLNGKVHTKQFPYTDEGLKDAIAWREAFVNKNFKEFVYQ